MKILIRHFFIVSILFISIGNIRASTIDTLLQIDQEHHSLSAPDAVAYQWHYNGKKIQGENKKSIKIEKTGTYKVEIINMHGDTTKIENAFFVTAAGAIIKIYIIGDSTVCNYSASDYPQAGWGQLIPSFFNTANLTFSNNAIGGRSSRSFFEEGRWTPIKDALNPGDYVFIQWGHNDRDFSNASRYTPVADYKTYLTMYCNDVKAKGAIPVLISPMVMNAWTGTTMRNVFTENGNNYRGAMLEVATALNVAFVDLNMKSWNLYKTYGAVFNQRFIYKGFIPGEYPNYPAGITDGTHFQEMGAICNARMIVEGISELSSRADMANLINNLKPQYTIAVAVNPYGKDSMTTKSYTYPVGLTVTLKTIPKKSSTFQKWNNAANTQISTATLTTITSGTASTSFTAIYTGSTACTATITASTATTFCAGGSVVLTSSTGSSYKWFNGATQVGTAATYTATAAGSYTVEVTNASGCKATSIAKVVTVNQLPVITQYVKIDAGAWLTAATASACETNTVNLGPQPNVAAGWSWTGPNNFTSTLRNPVLTGVTIANAGTYTATYTDANGCKTNSTFTLQITKPTATITVPVTTFCAGGSAVLTASAGASYKWFNGTTQVGTSATYAATAAGSYTVEVTNTSGCKAISVPTVITQGSIQLTPTITSSSTSFCAGGSVLLTASTGASYKWLNGTTQVGTSATYTATAAGSYTVEVTNASGCKATSTPIVITQGSMQLTPTITSSSTSFCPGGSVLLTTSAGASYKWFNGTTQVGTAATYTTSTGGSYTVEVTNTSGCKATSTPIVIAAGSAQQTPKISSSATAFCPGKSVLLTSSTGTSYKWFNGTIQVGTNDTYAATAGSYTVEVTNASGCKATSAAITITESIQSTPTITSAFTSFCTGGSTLLSTNIGPEVTYQWSNAYGKITSATNATYTVVVSGAYIVTVTNSHSCSATSAAIQITVTAATIWYADIDKDGKGDPAASQTACTQPTGYVSAAGDACPTDPKKSSAGACGCGNPETDTDGDSIPDCIDTDNDNDGVPDTNDCAPVDATIGVASIWYQDTDNDGSGDASSTLSACTQPAGYVSVAGDLCLTNPDKKTPGNCGCDKPETSCIATATVNSVTANILVVPQPFDFNTTIIAENAGSIESITIISASGILAEERHNIHAKEISIGNDLAAGLYSVIILTEKGIYTSKIIKK